MTEKELYQYAVQSLLSVEEVALAQVLITRWNPRMRSTAGRALLQKRMIELNPKLIPFGEAEVKTTILHELAHLIAWERHKHRGHGAPWKLACSKLGIPGEKATHALPLPRRSVRRKFRYVCAKCGYTFDRVRRLTRPSACSKCCKENNGGRFSHDFLFKEHRLSSTDD